MDDPPNPPPAETVVPSVSPAEVAWARLEEQLAWHDGKAKKNQRWYRTLKVVQITTGATIPVMAGADAYAWLVGGLGALVVVNEGLNQLFRFHDHWLNYRSTCEALRREKYLYLSAAPPYGGEPSAHALLSGRVEAILAQANKEWTQTQLPQGSERNQ